MAEIQLVIKIPEDLYKATVNGLDANEIWDLRLAVKNGTLLPKGHGRLIDADKLSDRLESSRDCHDFYKNEYQNGVYTGYDYSLDEVANSPTII